MAIRRKVLSMRPLKASSRVAHASCVSLNVLVGALDSLDYVKLIIKANYNKKKENS